MKTNRIKRMALVTSCSLLASISSSDAVIVTVDNIEYDITSYNTSWNGDKTLLRSQPWFVPGSDFSAGYTEVQKFADAVGNQLGRQLPGSGFGSPSHQGPFFGFYEVGGNVNTRYWNYNTNSMQNVQFDPGTNATFAKAVTRGGSQDFPILPTSPTVFTGPSGAWFDPIAAIGFDFTMTDGNLFTSIDDFPTLDNLDTTFDVWTGGTSLGTFGPGDSVDFGAGVSEFSITGIDPSIDGEDPLVFPIQLSFNSGTGSFTMVAITAVPEPSSTALLGLGGLALTLRRRR